MNVLIFCGGASPEHAISILSARSIVRAIDPTLYSVKIVGIDLQGHFRELETLEDVEICQPYHGRPTSLKRVNGKVFLECGWRVDMIFPVLHGPGGEDGSIQGLCEVLEVPYVGNDVRASALAMDKITSKILFQAYGLPVVPFKVLDKQEALPSYETLASMIGSRHLFVKPCALGSSIGVSPLTAENYDQKIQNAFSYGSKVLIEKTITGIEYECAILGHTDPVASGIGQIVVQNGDFYSYDIKYVNTHKASISPRSQLSPEHIAQIQKWSLQAFRALGCSGLARVDFLADQTGIFLNEVNTMPGFTSMSLYPLLWEEQGLKYKDLISKLIECAREAFQERQSYKKRLEHLTHVGSFSKEDGLDEKYKKTE